MQSKPRPPEIYQVAEQLYRAKKYDAAFAEYLALAEQGDEFAQVQVSYLFANGMGVRQDFDMAKSWAERAADGGNSVGQYYLGRLCMAEGDFARAVKCFQDSAGKGFIPSFIRLGRCYEFGRGVVKNRSDALRAYEAAMKADNIRGKAEFARRLIRGWRGLAGVPLGLKLMGEAVIQAVRTGCNDPEDYRLLW